MKQKKGEKMNSNNLQNNNEIQDLMDQYNSISHKIEQLEWQRKLLRFKIKENGGDIDDRTIGR